ncbi:MAG: ATP-binding protein [Erysipelotrichaceae bacterium]|nr:ATP-binding protein [Erysipelotrichaceae bacterium]
MFGRKKEQAQLEKYYDSDKSEFIVVYGRLRVGKTFLIRETFSDRLFFSFTGTTQIQTLSGQLERFSIAMKNQGLNPDNKKVHTWNQAFDLLSQQIALTESNQRKVIFLDEAPWLDTRRSGFIGALEYFWNAFASPRKDILLILCGSAASWMSKKLFQDRGGLHNRVTGRILLKPFTLGEVEAYLNAKGSGYQRYDIIECYMVFGGIPYYLDYIDKQFSIAINVDKIVFDEQAPLRNEFTELYSSLFGSSEYYLEIVTALGEKKKGMTREEIVNEIKLKDGGEITAALTNLELSGFIRIYYAYPNKKKGALYQLVDPFSLFWLTFLNKKHPTSAHYWSSLRDTHTLDTWRGYAFEIVCLGHISQIEKALGISGILTWISSWQSRTPNNGAQIDLLIKRDDHVVNVCEIKYAQSEFEIGKEYEEKLRNKISVFTSQTKSKDTTFLTLITTYGLKPGKHTGIVRAEVRMDDLFG